VAERVVRAPEQAVVEVVAVRAGDLVSAQQAVVRVLRAADLWVKVFVPETELGKVRLHQQVTVTIDSYPGRRFSGTVTQVASVSEYTPRNVQTPDQRSLQVFGVKVPEPGGEGSAGGGAHRACPSTAAMALPRSYRRRQRRQNVGMNPCAPPFTW
jgi:hypothetical protein